MATGELETEVVTEEVEEAEVVGQKEEVREETVEGEEEREGDRGPGGEGEGGGRRKEEERKGEEGRYIGVSGRVSGRALQMGEFRGYGKAHRI